MKRAITLAVALLLGLVSSELASEPGSFFYENDWLSLRYDYAVDLTYGSNFNTWKNANNSDVFHASYDLYLDGHGKYGFEVSALDLFKLGFGMKFRDLHVVPYRQAISFVNPTAMIFNAEPFDMGAHGSYELSFGALSTSYNVAAPVFDKSIVDYIISLVTNMGGNPHTNPEEPNGPITPTDPATGNHTFNETVPHHPTNSTETPV